MILVSISSAEDVLSNDVKQYDTFSSQGTENPSFCFFLDTRYIYWVMIVHRYATALELILYSTPKPNIHKNNLKEVI